MNDLVDEMRSLNQMVSVKKSFKSRLKSAAEEGLLLFVKWSLVVILAFFALNYVTNVISGAANGTNAVLYLTELQNKGYLPKVTNGQVPDKPAQ